MSYNFHVWFLQFQSLLQSANILDSDMAIQVSSEFISQLFTFCNLWLFAGYLISRCVLLTYGLVRGPISNLQVACVSCGVQPCCSLLTLSHTDAFVPFEVDRCASSGDLSWLQQCWHELKGNLMIVGLSVQTINFFFDHVYSTSCLYLV